MEYQDLRDKIARMLNQEYGTDDWEHKAFAGILLQFMADNGMGFIETYPVGIDPEAVKTHIKEYKAYKFKSLSELIKEGN